MLHLLFDKQFDEQNALTVDGVLRTNEMQVWFLAQHLVNTAQDLKRCRLIPH
jgi:hypothetical protein